MEETHKTQPPKNKNYRQRERDALHPLHPTPVRPRSLGQVGDGPDAVRLGYQPDLGDGERPTVVPPALAITPAAAASANEGSVSTAALAAFVGGGLDVQGERRK